MLAQLQERYHGSLAEDVFAAYGDNDIPTRAAALSFYSFLSVFPFVALLVWVSTMAGSQYSAKELVTQFSTFLPHDFVELIYDEVNHRMELSGAESAWLAAFHMFLVMLSAGAALRSMMFSFRQISRADAVMGVFAIAWRSIAFVVPVLVFVFIASFLVAVISYVVITLTDVMQTAWLVTPILWILVTVVLIGFLNGVYASGLIGRQNLPIHGWRGSIVAAALISIVTISLSLYFKMNPVNREWYGSPGFLINVLLWFYACATCLLLGAQVNASLHCREAGPTCVDHQERREPDSE